MCKNICLGPICDHFEYHFVFEEEDTTHEPRETTHPNMREEGHVEPWDPFFLVHVYVSMNFDDTNLGQYPKHWRVLICCIHDYVCH